MQHFTKGLLKSTRFSAVFLFSLVISACTSSEDLAGAEENTSPVSVEDAFTVDQGSATTLDLAANDSDADDGLDLASITVQTVPANGTVTVNADGTVDYTHDGSATTADSFTYTIRDNSGVVSNTASVTITVTLLPVNVPPAAADDAFTVNAGSTTKLNLVANDVDVDDGLDIASIAVEAGPANGVVIVNADGTVDYTHDGSATISDAFTYTIRDNSGALSNTATVDITVSIAPVNLPPTATADAFTVTKASTTTLDLAANDSDTDDGLDLASITIVAMPSSGSVTVNAGGTVDYMHNGSNTTADVFSYTIRDNAGAVSNVANVTLTIKHPPVAVDDVFSVTKGSATTLDLAANDTDVDDGLDLTSIALIAMPSSGAVAVNPDGTVDYTHDDSGKAPDAFTYTIKDNSGVVSNIGTVDITVTPVGVPAVKAGVYESTVVEGADDLEFVVSLESASTGTVTIDYATVDGTAIAGTDYAAASGVVQFAPGEVRKFVSVAVLNNPAAPSGTSKAMQLALSDPQNAVLMVDTAAGTIIDKDAMSSDTAFNSGWSPVGAFTNAAKCGESCHKSDGVSMTVNSDDISPGTQWQHSVMAHAFNDPYWQAAVEDEVESFPLLTGLIEDTCTKCHAPMGRTHAHQTNTSLDVDGYYRFDTAKSQNHAREGVSCTLCHQIDDGNLGTAGSFSGEFTIADSADPDYKRIYGQYANPVGGNMNMQTGHQPTEGQHISGSALCATCHTLYTPAIDPATGTPSGISFLEQGPYLEWQNSVFATGQAQEAQCQDCHMPEPAAGYSTKISLLPGSAPTRTPPPAYGQHTLVGGNAHLLEILRDYRSELGIAGTTSASGFDEQIALTRSFLGSAAAVAVSAPQQVGSNLEFDVVVTNNAGHKLPSSYPSRRTWLHVAVRDNGGNVVFESGKPDARGYISTDEARLKGDCMSIDKFDGFDSGVCYEPHRDVISNPAQVAIYETVLGDVNSQITHTLLRGAEYLKDNRIPPAGFTNATATTIEAQTIPSGVTGDSDFNCVGTAEGCGADTVHYRVDNTGSAGPYTVEVRLLYQATQPAFVDGMHTDGDRVNRFKVMYDAVPPSTEVLATASSP